MSCPILNFFSIIGSAARASDFALLPLLQLDPRGAEPPCKAPHSHSDHSRAWPLLQEHLSSSEGLAQSLFLLSCFLFFLMTRLPSQSVLCTHRALPAQAASAIHRDLLVCALRRYFTYSIFSCEAASFIRSSVGCFYCPVLSPKFRYFRAHSGSG